MSHWFAVVSCYLPSLRLAAAISVAGACAFVAWLFLDCSFSVTASLAGQNLLRFLRDAHVRFWNRWEWYGPRLLAFAVLGLLCAASVMIMLFLALGGESPLPIDMRWCFLPRNEVLRLDYEPDPSRSTHCYVVPGNYRDLEPYFVDTKSRKDRDYAGYRVFMSYVQLASDFEWLDAKGETQRV